MINLWIYCGSNVMRIFFSSIFLVNETIIILFFLYVVNNSYLFLITQNTIDKICWLHVPTLELLKEFFFSYLKFTLVIVILSLTPYGIWNLMKIVGLSGIHLRNCMKMLVIKLFSVVDLDLSSNFEFLKWVV